MLSRVLTPARTLTPRRLFSSTAIKMGAFRSPNVSRHLSNLQHRILPRASHGERRGRQRRVPGAAGLYGYSRGGAGGIEGDFGFSSASSPLRRSFLAHLPFSRAGVTVETLSAGDGQNVCCSPPFRHSFGLLTLFSRSSPSSPTVPQEGRQGLHPLRWNPPQRKQVRLVPRPWIALRDCCELSFIPVFIPMLWLTFLHQFSCRSEWGV
jgi:hypothetical protein